MHRLQQRVGCWLAGGIGATLYVIWATVAIVLAIALGGLSVENITRLLVLAFLFIQIVWRSLLVKSFPWLMPKGRFILLGTVLASIVEGFHLISMPVFRSLRIDWDTPLMGGLFYYAIDLLFTIPAYIAIFSAIWYFINRYYYSLWRYIAIVGLAQALGDGGLFFFFLKRSNNALLFALSHD